MTEEQRSAAIQLRADGLSMSAIAKQLDVPLTTLWKMFQRQKKVKPKQGPIIEATRPPTPFYRPSNIFHTRQLPINTRQLPQMNRDQMREDFAQAWRNTSLIAEKIK